MNIKLDLDRVLLDESDEAIMLDRAKPERGCFTVRIALRRILLQDTPDNNSTQLERFDLAMALRNSDGTLGEAELRLIDGSLRSLTTVVRGQIHYAIEAAKLEAKRAAEAPPPPVAEAAPEAA